MFILISLAVGVVTFTSVPVVPTPNANTPPNPFKADTPDADVDIVIEPAPLVIFIPEPAVSVAFCHTVPLPISNSPFAGVDEMPVPPWLLVNTPPNDVRLILLESTCKFIEPVPCVNVKPNPTLMGLPS